MTEKPCKFYISGKKCKFGKHCRFLHSQEINKFQSEVNSFERNGILSENNPVCDLVQGLNNTSFDSPAFDNQQNESVRSVSPVRHPNFNSSTICYFYVQNGYCGYGRNCRYSHPDPRQIESKLNDDPVRENFKPVYTESEFAGTSGTDAPKFEYDGSSELRVTGNVSGNIDDGGKKRICSFFSQHGHCKFGRGCRFLHFCTKTFPQKERTSAGNDSKPQNPSKKKRKRICPHFKAGFCKWGQRCQYWHPKDLMEIGDGECNLDEGTSPAELDVKPQPVLRAVRKPVVPIKLTPKRSTATDEEIKSLHRTEVEQLKKRFPFDKLTLIEDSSEKFVASFCFTPSDPDWPFDVKQFVLEVNIPANYPVEMLRIKLPTEQDMLEIIRRHVEESISKWIDDKSQNLEKSDKLEIIFRPFLRWLEKNLEDIVTIALRQYKKELIAKAAGFEFISATQLQANVKQDARETTEECSDSTESHDCSDNEEEAESSSENDDKETQSVLVADVERKGTEISFKNLQLKDESGTLLFKKIHIEIQCARCKTKSEFNTPGNRYNSVDCTKCNETQILRFRPAIAHQFSSVIGYLDLDNCIPFDLILQECQPVVSCMNCNKTTDIMGFCSGQAHDINCRSCHEKLRIAVEAVRFLELQQKVETADIKQIHKIGVKKSTRVSKDPAIQEGNPLPSNGACKHYKKSYRWLRFPCCGKTYPCDICHEENETDHEMKYANRMICGHCCREQIYSVEKPCKGCSQLMTKSSGCHWEGGQGCRDKIKMNRGDSQKYSNMGKTLSRQSQKIKDMNKKKKTKLRHA